MVGKVCKVVQVRGSEEVIVGRWRVPAAANPQPAPLSTHHRGSLGVRCFPSVSVRVRWWLSPMLTQPPDPPLLTSLSHGTRRGNLGADDRKTRNHNRPKHHHQLWPEAFLRFLRRRTIRPQSIPSQPCPGRPGPQCAACCFLRKSPIWGLVGNWG